MENEKKRGFANMTPEARAEISRKGGRAAHAQGKAHQFNSEEAKVVGKKGGVRSGEVRATKAKEKILKKIQSTESI
jgi:general stress protein YciG